MNFHTGRQAKPHPLTPHTHTHTIILPHSCNLKHTLNYTPYLYKDLYSYDMRFSRQKSHVTIDVYGCRYCTLHGSISRFVALHIDKDVRVIGLRLIRQEPSQDGSRLVVRAAVMIVKPSTTMAKLYYPYYHIRIEFPCW